MFEPGSKAKFQDMDYDTKEISWIPVTIIERSSDNWLLVREDEYPDTGDFLAKESELREVSE